MKAAYIRNTGLPSCIQYGDVPDPEVGPDQVLVRIEAVSINPIDTYIRSGNVKLDLPSPYIVGCDFAGVVEQVGVAVKDTTVGTRVWGSNQGLAGRQGTFSEFVAVDECWLYPTPDSVPSDVAAAGALTGITAHLGLHLHAGVRSGDVVFVNGGTGGVGSAVVQLSKAHGATVVTTVGDVEKATLAKQAGADFVVNYKEECVADRLKEITESTGGISLWFETLRSSNLDTTISFMAKRGRIVLMAGRDARPEFPVGAFYVNDLRAFGFAMFNASHPEQRQAALQLNELLAAGKWTPMIGARFSLSETAAAHQLQEDNTLHGAGTLTGKIVLTP